SSSSRRTQATTPTRATLAPERSWQPSANHPKHRGLRKPLERSSGFCIWAAVRQGGPRLWAKAGRLRRFLVEVAAARGDRADLAFRAAGLADDAAVVDQVDVCLVRLPRLEQLEEHVMRLIGGRL